MAGGTAVKRLLERADAEWMAKKTLEMVEIKSVTMDEAEMCRYYADALRSLGLAVDVREVTPGRNNLYARIPGTGGGPTLALNGHADAGSGRAGCPQHDVDAAGAKAVFKRVDTCGAEFDETRPVAPASDRARRRVAAEVRVRHWLAASPKRRHCHRCAVRSRIAPAVRRKRRGRLSPRAMPETAAT